MSDDTLRIASANLQYGGLDLATGSDERWRHTIDALAEWAPHVVLIQEMSSQRPAQLQAHLWRTANALNMIPLLGPLQPGSVGGSYPAILVERTGLTILDAGPPTWPPGSGPAPAWCQAVIHAPGLRDPLHVYSVHMPARAAAAQVEQAQRLACLVAQAGALAILGGDWNCYVPTDRLTPELLAAKPPHLRPSRMHADADGNLSPNFDVHSVLAAVGLRDAAPLLPPDQRTPPGLTGTGNAEHGRIDRFYLSKGLDAAAVAYCQADTGGSDHQALLLTLDTHVAARVTPGPPAP